MNCVKVDIDSGTDAYEFLLTVQKRSYLLFASTILASLAVLLNIWIWIYACSLMGKIFWQWDETFSYKLLIAILAPSILVVTSLFASPFKAKARKLLNSALHPRGLAYSALCTCAALTLITCDLVFRVYSTCDFDLADSMAADAPDLKLQSLSEQFKDFQSGAAAKSSHSRLLYLYMESLAARQASSLSYPAEMGELTKSLTFGTPLRCRILAHLAAANFAKASGDYSQFVTHTTNAITIADGFFLHDALEPSLFQGGFLSLKFSSIAPTEAEKGEDIAMARTCFEKILSIDKANDFNVLQVYSRLGSTSATKGDWQQALNEWNRGLDHAKPMIIIVGDMYNNIGVAYMVMSSWSNALNEFQKVNLFYGGDDRRTALNRAICLNKLNRRSEAKAALSSWIATTERSADYAIIGWSCTGSERLTYYAKALGLPDLKANDITDDALEKMATLCNKDYLGLHLKSSDFK